MSKHTPGPWHADHEEAPTAIRAKDGPAICHVYDSQNVALIAAAPYMLEALDEIQHMPGIAGHARNLARAGIIKAKGETE